MEKTMLTNNFSQSDSHSKNVLFDLKKESVKFDELQSLLSKEGRVFSELKKRLFDYLGGQILVNCDSINNHDFLVALSKFVISKNKIPVIVLTSTNYKSAIFFLKEAKIDAENIFLIDTVSKNIFLINDSDKIFFVDSLRNLTQLQIKIVKLFMKHKNIVLIVDSLNVLNLYHNEKIIYKFVYSLTKILHKYKVDSFFIVNKQSWAQKIGQFCDEIIEIEKIE